MYLYFIKNSYIDYLRKYDSNIPQNKNETRPYVGVVLNVNGIKYFAPLTSPKPKHIKMNNRIDFRLIANGKMGAINLNNMIPVLDKALISININLLKDCAYKRLLQNQISHIKNIEKEITTNAEKLRLIILTKNEMLSSYEQKLKKRCCNLYLLETIYELYK